MKFQRKNDVKFCRYYLGKKDVNPYGDDQMELRAIWLVEQKWVQSINQGNYVTLEFKIFDQMLQNQMNKGEDLRVPGMKREPNPERDKALRISISPTPPQLKYELYELYIKLCRHKNVMGSLKGFHDWYFDVYMAGRRRKKEPPIGVWDQWTTREEYLEVYAKRIKNRCFMVIFLLMLIGYAVYAFIAIRFDL